MKEEKLIKTISDIPEIAFDEGAEWKQSQYNGLTPDTVKEMLDEIKNIKEISIPANARNGYKILDICISIIAKAEKELKP